MFSSAFLLLFFAGFANSCLFTVPRMGIGPLMTYSRPTAGCAEVELQVLNLAVKLCPHGSDRFTWAEVENCAAQLYRSVILKEDVFEMMDANGDGVLTIEEWKEFEGC
eukprot:GFUD01036925.1.p1 GENE.GFUD01036925.1~~GFUD01036925.1.p1  ORF type:complete len:108 (-),score=11.34 GFUD01036925.1:106-429(-)